MFLYPTGSVKHCCEIDKPCYKILRHLAKYYCIPLQSQDLALLECFEAWGCSVCIAFPLLKIVSNDVQLCILKDHVGYPNRPRSVCRIVAGLKYGAKRPHSIYRKNKIDELCLIVTLRVDRALKLLMSCSSKFVSLWPKAQHPRIRA